MWILPSRPKPNIAVTGGNLRTSESAKISVNVPYFWKMEDQRSQRWYTDRIVSLGDAATGFFPTAGIGASIAMESAGILAHLIANSDIMSYANALSEFEARQRHRSELAQRGSRALARVVFVNSPIIAFLRDQAMRLYPSKWLADGLLKMLTRPSAA